MNPKNEWLDEEIQKLRYDEKLSRRNKAEKRKETWMVAKFLCLLLPLLFYAVFLHGSSGYYHSKLLKTRYIKQVDGGVQFTCKRCRTSQWQDKNNADWRGNYYCRKCGCKIGEE